MFRTCRASLPNLSIFEKPYGSYRKYMYKANYAMCSGRYILVLGQVPSHVRSVGNFIPIRTSTTDTSFWSALIEATPGKFPSELTMTTQYNQAETVSLRLEVNRVKFSMKPLVRLQSKKARVFNEG